MKTIIIKSVLIILLTTTCQACDEKVNFSKLSHIEKSIYNPERSDDDREQDGKRKLPEILKLLEIKDGMSIVDLDAGSGYFTEIFSYLVGKKGKVYLQNGPRFLSKNSKLVEDRLIDRRLPNVTRIDSSYINMSLPEKIDIIFASKVFHDIYVIRETKSWNADKPLYFSQLRDSLKAGGKLVIIDHSAEKDTEYRSANNLHRIEKDFTRKQFESNGFILIKESDLFRNPEDDKSVSIWDKKYRGKTDQFFMIFKKI